MAHQCVSFWVRLLNLPWQEATEAQYKEVLSKHNPHKNLIHHRKIVGDIKLENYEEDPDFYCVLKKKIEQTTKAVCFGDIPVGGKFFRSCDCRHVLCEKTGEKEFVQLTKARPRAKYFCVPYEMNSNVLISDN